MTLSYMCTAAARTYLMFMLTRRACSTPCAHGSELQHALM